MTLLICIVAVIAIVVLLLCLLIKRGKQKTEDVETTRVVEENYENGKLRRKYICKTITRQPGNKVLFDGIDGKEEYYYPSGALNRENQWVRNALQGLFTVYYEDGKTYIKGSFKNGKLNGKYIVYDKTNHEIWSKKY